MSERLTRATAQCADCGAVYNVSDTHRTYSCKACGGTVRARRESVIEGTITCPKCGAINPCGAHFCAECETVLEFSSAGGGEDVELRLAASNTLRRAQKWITAVMQMYRFGAVCYAIATVFAILALGRPEVPLGPGVLVVALTTALSVLMGMAALHMLFKPFVWTVAIAVLASAVTVVHLVGPNPFGLAFVGSAAWAALGWAAIAPTFRFRRLIAKHEELYILQHASRQTKRSLRGRFPKERHERLMAAMRRAALRAWKVSVMTAAGVCAASALGTYFVVAQMRPQQLGPVLDSFREAWNSGAVDAVGRFFDPAVREGEVAWLTGAVVGHGWADALPFLDEGRRHATDESAEIEYELGDVGMSARWRLDGQEWRLIGIEMPVPPLEPTFEGFLSAWRSSEPTELAGFFSVEKRDEMLASIRHAATSRGWSSFPDVVDVTVSDYSDGRGVVTMALSRGDVTTDWHLRGDGTWALHGLKFPKR